MKNNPALPEKNKTAMISHRGHREKLYNIINSADSAPVRDLFILYCGMLMVLVSLVVHKESIIL